MEIIERIYNDVFVDYNGCHLWTGYINPVGYGTISVKSKTRLLHRLIYELNYGEIPKGLCVCHRCDVRNCVNPKHLFLGTKGDNYRDCVAKGRSPNIRPYLKRDESHPTAKLKNSQIIEIRSSCESNSSLAKRYGVSHSTIWSIRKGLRYIEIEQ